MASSIGSEIFSKLPGTTTKIALALATTLPNVSRWGSGERVPTADMQRKIFETFGRPTPDEWRQELVPPEYIDPPTFELQPAERATPQVVETEADEWLRALRKARTEAELISDVSDRLRALESGSRSLLVLGKMTGAGLNLTEARILSSPQWRAIESVIMLALEPWPEAMRAVAESLKQVAGLTQADPPGRTE